MEYIEWIIANQENIHDIFKALWITVSSVVTVASLIVKLTPTLKDDDALLPVVKFLAKYGALNTNAPIKRPKS